MTKKKNKAEKSLSKILSKKQKILKKPKAKGIQPISTEKVLRKDKTYYRLAREVEQPETQEDKRSLFFRGEYNKEEKWLS